METLRTRWIAHGTAGLTFIGLGALYRFSPERYPYYPQCPIFRYWHVYCPGCGATRALAALLHGRIAQALYYNPLAVVLLPLVAALFVKIYSDICRGRPAAWPELPPRAVKALLAAMFLFALLRNAALHTF